jgi:CRISPR-associated endonuclease/helicase Cas3
MSPSKFFATNYRALQPHARMLWMERMFLRLIAGDAPHLVDLQTGAGKTQLVVIWLLALAWLGANGRKGSPVPRRLVWIVNRRVLVQQVFKLANELRQKLGPDGTAELNGLRKSLGTMGGEGSEVFQVVELRGQIVADRDWAIHPTVPQLIIGTVDQIGSRLLFQGYGLGKWGRPQQAGLLGVDSWVAVDEAHLVPAFVLTLRQLRERCASTSKNLTSPFDNIFRELPFWLTELSATPSLPRPSAEVVFSLTDEEKEDSTIADRILAAGSRQVLIVPLRKGEKPKDILVQQLVEAAGASKASRVAIFVCEVGVADRIADGIKKLGIAPGRICKITGRIRGYERDRLAAQPAFLEFLGERSEPSPKRQSERSFLVGTAAAEVGLDADADEILCDFTSLPTLLQRLGRLDRRGVLSRRYADGNGEPPTMRIFATKPEAKQRMLIQLSKVSAALKIDTASHSAKLMAGTHWLAEEKKETDGGEGEAGETKFASNVTEVLIAAATWSVLSSTSGACTPPKDWLAHDLARVAAGPVNVPPLTETVLDYWSATTAERSPQLSPHPFLYGLGDNDEGTPLVGVAFRLEVEALRAIITNEDDDPESPDLAAEVEEIFQCFPPLRAELHQMKLSAVRDWLATPEAKQQPLVFRDRDKWRAKPAGESTDAAIRALGTNGTFILPASNAVRSKATDTLLKDCQQDEAKDTAISDVLDGVTKAARYRRTVEPVTGRTGTEGAWLWNFKAENAALVPKPSLNGFNTRRPLLKRLRIGATEYTFRYFRPEHSSTSLQYLDDHDRTPGHITRAKAEASRLAETIAPGDVFLRTLLIAAARYHDEGKRFAKWQTAFGRRSGQPELAKLHPDLETPSKLHGFRHEWESLRKLVAADIKPPPELTPESQALWIDLLLHLVGAHHGHLRPSISDTGFTPNMETEKHSKLRLAAAERFARLQSQLGRWRLAYLEALLKTADAEGSRILMEEEQDEI